eukprot:gene4405-7780_t
MNKIPNKTNVEEIKLDLDKKTKENMIKIYSRWNKKEYKDRFTKKYSNDPKLLKSKIDELVPKLIQEYFPNKKLGIIFTTSIPEFILEKEISIENLENIIQNLGKEKKEKLNEILKNVQGYLNDENEENNYIISILFFIRNFGMTLLIYNLLEMNKEEEEIDLLKDLEYNHYLNYCKNDGKQELKKILNILSIQSNSKQKIKELEELNLNNSIIKFNLGLLYRNGNENEIKKSLNLIIESSIEGFIPAKSYLGSLYIQSSDENKQKEGRELIEIAAEFGEIKAQYHMGLIFGLEKNYEKSIEWYKRTIKNNDFLFGNESTKIWAEDNLKVIQNEYENEKQFQEIELSMELLSEEDQLEVSNDIKERGNELFLNGYYTIALKYYLLAFAYDQSNYLILSNISATFYKMNNFKDALQTATKSTEINPTFAKGYFRKGCCFEAMNQYKKSIIEFKKAYELDNKNEEYKKRIEKLSKIIKN